MKIRIAVGLMALALSIVGEARPGDEGCVSYTPTGGCVTSAPPPKPEVSVIHFVQPAFTRNDVTVKNSLNWDGLMSAYSGEEIFKRLQSLPGIQSLQFVPGEHVLDEKQTDKSLITSSRRSALIARVGVAQSPFSFMFRVEETLKRCADTTVVGDSTGAAITDSAMDEKALSTWVTQAVSDDFNGKTSPCKKESKIKVTGPIAIYGSMPGNFTDRLLMLNQVSWEWSIGNDNVKTGTEIKTMFRVERPDFPAAINKILSWTQTPTVVSEIVLGSPQQLALRQIGRILKAKNQEILQGL